MDVEMKAMPTQEVMSKPKLMASALVLPKQEDMEINLLPDFIHPRWDEGCHCMADNVSQRDQTDVPVEELRPCCANCCTIHSFFLGFPSCIGFSGTCKILCCNQKYVCCKFLDCKDDDKRCMAVQVGATYLVLPQTCIECTRQDCCVESRCAFPCTKNVPCLVSFLGITCCADFGCKFAPPCTRLGDIIPRLDESVGKDAGPGA